MTSQNILLLYSPFPDAPSATLAARALLKSRLIACANILPASSALYWWEGKVAQESETILLAKTDSAHEAQARAELTGLHPYDTPAILSFPATANAAYFEWLTTNLTPIQVGD